MNNIVPDEPFKDFDELLDILKSRNLIIESEEKAKYILLTFSYYDLINEYKDLFMVNDTFKDGISLSYLNLLLCSLGRFKTHYFNIVSSLKLRLKQPYRWMNQPTNRK